MPELPEVETIKNYIKPILERKKFQEVKIINPNLRFKTPIELQEILTNQEIKIVERRAKYIIVKCTDNINLIIHLGMTGKIRAYENTPILQKHDHIIFKLNNQNILIYNDVRKFGFITYERTSNSKNISFIKKLGIEPLSKEFNKEYFKKLSKNSKIEIKKFIMDQNFIVGVGNIYACEALFLSKINPKTITNQLNVVQQELLVKNIKKILKNAIAKGGSTIKDFQLVNGESGYFQNSLNVYGREKKPCKICNSLLNKIKQGGRSTFYCESCQK
ncbi:MAG: bifunctional DNA-formamidopyrimidine glycosylase/DNA-(apurinic or apyrimidinic site) lyase [Rickettsiales bacterium]|nr:bifunctional DNA-formamidopyrimidine glycosylase/DNA-(apurinic or apyrimidinic site) lyase [Rickettsiales bacterium]